jgi:hypothetical protein
MASKQHTFPQVTDDERMRLVVDRVPKDGVDGFEISVTFKDSEELSFFHDLAEAEGMTPDEYLHEVLKRGVIRDVAEKAASEGLSIEEWMAKSVGGVQYTAMEKAIQAPLKIPRSPDPFNDGETAPVARNPYALHIGTAIAMGDPKARAKVGGWTDNTTNEAPQYRDEKSSWRGGSMTTYFEAKDYNAVELWAKVNGLSALALDVYLAILALICDPRNNAAAPAFGYFDINPEQIADLKSFRRYGNDRRVLVRKIVEAVYTLSEFQTDIVNIPYHRDKNTGRVLQTVTERGCKFFHIDASIYIEQGELFEHPKDFPEDKQPVSIRAIAGAWVRLWLNDAGKYRWTAVATRALLELGDSRAELLAKKIGALILTVEGGTNSQNIPITMTIDKLLQRIGELLEDKHRGKRGGGTQKGMHWAQRTEEGLFGTAKSENGLFGDDDQDKQRPGAFVILQDLGLLATFEKGETYPEPGDRGRGWVDRWLAATVTLITTKVAANVEQRASASKKLQQMRRKARTRGTGRPRKVLEPGQYLDAVTAARLRMVLGERYGNQTAAAAGLGISQGYLSRVLAGRHAPSPDLARRIKEILGTLH